MPRREFLGNAAMVGAAILTGAYSTGALAQAAAPMTPAMPGADGVRQLVLHAARNAVAKLSQPEGFWNSNVARCGIPILFSRTRANAAGPLGQDAFRQQLQHRVNNLAEIAIRGAAPTIEAATRKLAVADPAGVVRGSPTGATTLLRAEVKSDAVNAMIVALEPVLAGTPDPVITQAMQALAALGPVTNRDVAHAIALVADNGAWYEIGSAEAAIRRNPAALNDPVLTATFTGV